jgi:hypothetical protein
VVFAAAAAYRIAWLHLILDGWASVDPLHFLGICAPCLESEPAGTPELSASIPQHRGVLGQAARSVDGRSGS